MGLSGKTSGGSNRLKLSRDREGEAMARRATESDEDASLESPARNRAREQAAMPRKGHQT